MSSSISCKILCLEIRVANSAENCKYFSQADIHGEDGGEAQRNKEVHFWKEFHLSEPGSSEWFKSVNWIEGLL